MPVGSREELEDINAVKVVCDGRGRALYFSRAPIPCDRDDPGAYASAASSHRTLRVPARVTVEIRSALEPTRLERAEKLEQLRALENGMSIGVVVHDGPPPMEVDTTEDLERARRAVAGRDTRMD